MLIFSVMLRIVHHPGVCRGTALPKSMRCTVYFARLNPHVRGAIVPVRRRDYFVGRGASVALGEIHARIE